MIFIYIFIRLYVRLKQKKKVMSEIRVLLEMPLLHVRVLFFSKGASVPQLVLSDNNLLAVGLESNGVAVDEARQPCGPALQSLYLCVFSVVNAVRSRDEGVCLLSTHNNSKHTHTKKKRISIHYLTTKEKREEGQKNTDRDGSLRRITIVVQGVQLTEVFLGQIVKHLTDIQIFFHRRPVEPTVQFARDTLHFVPVFFCSAHKEKQNSITYCTVQEHGTRHKISTKK